MTYATGVSGFGPASAIPNARSVGCGACSAYETASPPPPPHTQPPRSRPQARARPADGQGLVRGSRDGRRAPFALRGYETRANLLLLVHSRVRRVNVRRASCAGAADRPASRVPSRGQVPRRLAGVRRVRHLAGADARRRNRPGSLRVLYGLDGFSPAGAAAVAKLGDRSRRSLARRQLRRCMRRGVFRDGRARRLGERRGGEERRGGIRVRASPLRRLPQMMIPLMVLRMIRLMMLMMVVLRRRGGHVRVLARSDAEVVDGAVALPEREPRRRPRPDHRLPLQRVRRPSVIILAKV